MKGAKEAKEEPMRGHLAFSEEAPLWYNIRQLWEAMAIAV